MRGGAPSAQNLVNLKSFMIDTMANTSAGFATVFVQ